MLKSIILINIFYTALLGTVYYFGGFEVMVFVGLCLILTQYAMFEKIIKG